MAYEPDMKINAKELAIKREVDDIKENELLQFINYEKGGNNTLGNLYMHLSYPKSYPKFFLSALA